MTIFRYKALTADGKKTAGTIDAPGRKDASQMLRERGIHVTTLDAAGGLASTRIKQATRRGKGETYIFTAHMRRLLRARLPLVEALDATASEISDTPMGAMVVRLRDKVSGGASLAEALSGEPDYFDELYVSMIQAAQASGTLAAALDNIYQYEGRRREFRRKLTSALAYPIVLVSVATLTVTFLMSYVVPKIAATLQSAKIELPLITKILIAVSGVAHDYWPVMVGLMALAIFSPRILRGFEKGRAFIDRTMINAPIARYFVRAATIARFSRTFSALLVTGLRVADALEIAGRVAGNSVFQAAVSQARSRIVSGGDLQGALAEGGMMPGYALQIIGVGERTGSLAESFEEIAKAEEEMLETSTAKFLTFLEPVIILTMALVVGFIVASVLLPILSLSGIGGA